MTRQRWMLIYGLLLAAVAIDALTKTWAAVQGGPLSFGPLEFVQVESHGTVLGYLSDLPNAPRVIGGSILLASVVFLSMLIQFVIPWKALPLRIGLNLAVAGVLGNFIDRVFSGHVVDFVRIHTGFGSTPFFNLADLLQIVGLALVGVYLLRERQEIFFENEKRSGYWVNPSFQRRYCLAFVLGGLGLGFVLVLFSTVYWGAVVESVGGGAGIATTEYIRPYLMTAGSMMLALLAMIVIFGLILSHRIAGPMYALERFLIERRGGETGKFSLRESDDFKQLERIVNELLH